MPLPSATSHVVFFLSIFINPSPLLGESSDVKCNWRSPSGHEFDLSGLKNVPGESYYIRDGDIPCTPEIEPSYSYVWNVCAEVDKSKIPTVCQNKTGSVLQYQDDGVNECHVLGKSDSIEFDLLDSRDPSKGISLQYTKGEKCRDTGKDAIVQIDFQCANVKSVIESASEPNLCKFHIVMKSYFGCPKVCPVTINGLCSSHGHCHYDSGIGGAYCYCNQGFYGDTCQPRNRGKHGQGGNDQSRQTVRVQMGLLGLLLLLSIALTAVTGMLVRKVASYRKQQATDYLSLAETEMTTVKF